MNIYWNSLINCRKEMKNWSWFLKEMNPKRAPLVRQLVTSRVNWFKTEIVIFFPLKNIVSYFLLIPIFWALRKNLMIKLLLINLQTINKTNKFLFNFGKFRLGYPIVAIMQNCQQPLAPRVLIQLTSEFIDNAFNEWFPAEIWIEFREFVIHINRGSCF